MQPSPKGFPSLSISDQLLGGTRGLSFRSLVCTDFFAGLAGDNRPDEAVDVAEYRRLGGRVGFKVNGTGVKMSAIEGGEPLNPP